MNLFYKNEIKKINFDNVIDKSNVMDDIYIKNLSNFCNQGVALNFFSLTSLDYVNKLINIMYPGKTSNFKKMKSFIEGDRLDNVFCKFLIDNSILVMEQFKETYFGNIEGIEIFLRNTFSLFFLLSNTSHVKLENVKTILRERVFSNKTLEDVGKILNITRERVRQIEAKVSGIIRNFVSAFNFNEKISRPLIINDAFNYSQLNFLKIVFNCKFIKFKKYILLWDGQSKGNNQDKIIFYDDFNSLNIDNKFIFLTKIENPFSFDNEILFDKNNISMASAIRFLADNSIKIDLSDPIAFKNYINNTTNPKNDLFNIWFMTERITDSLGKYKTKHKPRIFSQLVSPSVSDSLIQVNDFEYVNLDRAINKEKISLFIESKLENLKKSGLLSAGKYELRDIALITPPIIIQSNKNDNGVEYVLFDDRGVYQFVKKYLPNSYWFNSENSISINFINQNLKSKYDNFYEKLKNLEILIINSNELGAITTIAKNTLSSNKDYENIIKFVNSGNKVINKIYLKKIIEENENVKLSLKAFINDVNNSKFGVLDSFEYLELIYVEIQNATNNSIPNLSMEIQRSLFNACLELESSGNSIFRIGSTSLFSVKNISVFKELIETMIDYEFKNKIVNYYEFYEFVTNAIKKPKLNSLTPLFSNAILQLVKDSKIWFMDNSLLKFQSITDNAKTYVDHHIQLNEDIRVDKILYINNENYVKHFDKRYNYFELVSILLTNSKYDIIRLSYSPAYLNNFSFLIVDINIVYSGKKILKLKHDEKLNKISEFIWTKEDNGLSDNYKIILEKISDIE